MASAPINDQSTALAQIPCLSTYSEVVTCAQPGGQARGKLENDRQSQWRIKRARGWLILVGIGVVLDPIQLLFVLITSYKPIFEDASWEALTTVGSETYIPNYSTGLVIEILFNLTILVASIYLIYLFFSKHYLFPKLHIGVLAVSLLSNCHHPIRLWPAQYRSAIPNQAMLRSYEWLTRMWFSRKWSWRRATQAEQ